MVEDLMEPVKDRRSGRRRVVLFGMRCEFTRPVLAALMDSSSFELGTLVLPTQQKQINDTGTYWGEAHRAPTYEVPARWGLWSPQFRARLEAIAPDVIVVACFPWRLPHWILALPPLGCLNIHPSLLPDGRGPEPVFWAFRWGLEETGVSLHLMDEDFDTGPVVAQRRFMIPEDATMVTLEQALSHLGAEMLVDYLSALPSHEPPKELPSPPETRYAGTPKPGDLVVSTSWPANQAARFIHAVRPAYGPISVLVQATGQRLSVDRVIRLNEQDTIPEPLIVAGDEASIQFSRGVLVCLLKHVSSPLRLGSPGLPTTS